MIPPSFGPVHKKSQSIDNTANDPSKRISEQTQKRLANAVLLFSSDKEEALQISKTIEQLACAKHPTSSKEYRDKIKLIESSIKVHTINRVIAPELLAHTNKMSSHLSIYSIIKKRPNKKCHLSLNLLFIVHLQ